MSEIRSVSAREILDSRGNPTVEVEVESARGIFGRASVPSGVSTGEREALELRDGDADRYGGKGVLSAVRNVEELISPEISGLDLLDQNGVDQVMVELDGTPDKERLGANAVLAVSLACARAAAAELGLPLYRYIGGCGAKVLPVPMITCFSGGMHSDAKSAFQEYMIRPVGAESFPEALRMGARVRLELEKLLDEKHWTPALGDDGGFAPPELSGGAAELLAVLTSAVERAGFTPGEEITIAIDAASGAFFADNVYDYSIFEDENAPKRTGKEQVAFFRSLAEKFPVDSIEDGAAEEDWDSWEQLTAELGDKCQLVGDDLFASNPRYLRQGIDRGCANAILLKPNQIGTLTEVCDTAAMARNAGYKCIVSLRSGETCDPFAADLAVALGAGQIKAGALCGERVAVYNQLLRISEQLDDVARFGSLW